MAAKGDDTQLLIILLSVISGLSATLLVVLVIVCIRCRLMRMSVSDHVYSEPSPALQAHYDYISSLDAEKSTPQLADEYFEVADALPFCMRDTPASPAYAEVEQFLDFKKSQWSSMDSTEWKDCHSQYSSIVSVSGDEVAASGDSADPKEVKKGSKSKSKTDIKVSRIHKHKRVVKSSNSPEPRVYIVNMDKRGQQDRDAACDDSGYEQIEIQTNGDTNKIVYCDPKNLSKTPPIEKREKRRTLGKIKSSSPDTKRPSPAPSPSYTKKLSRVDQIKEGLLSKHGDKRDASPKKKESELQNSATANSDSSSPIVASKIGNLEVEPQSKTTTASTNDTTNKTLSVFVKDRLQNSGIVRNGIQKFEQK